MFVGQTAYYGALDAVTGATSLVDWQPLFKESGEICWAEILSSPTENSNELLMAVGNAQGEILVFTGDYPDAANWELIATFKVGRVCSYNGVLSYNNDVWVATENGIVSLRKMLYFGDSRQQDISVSALIDDYWSDVVMNVSDGTTDGNFLFNASMAYWPQENKIYVLANGHIDKDGTFTDLGTSATLYVYNTISEAWAIQKVPSVDSTGVSFLTYFKNGMFFSTGNVIMRISPTVYKDEDYDGAGTYNSYETEIQSAYNQLGSSFRFKRITGVNVLSNTDFDGGNVGFLTSADFGRKISGNGQRSQSILQSGYNNTIYSCGTEGAYLQWRLDGESDTTSTNGYELYAIGMQI